MDVIKLLSAIVLLFVTAFCAFGFLATFEPPGSIGFRIAYGVVGVLSLSAAAWLFAGAFRKKHVH